MNSTFERIKKIQEILDEKAYLQDSAKLPAWRRFAHFVVLVGKSFLRNRGPVRAASLAYTTILSLIPVLAVVVSISTAFLQNDKSVVNNLLDNFVEYVAPQLNLIEADPETGAMNRQAVVEKIQGYIEAVNSGTLGLTAGLALVFIAVTVLSNVESTFNDIWGVSRGRSWAARIVQYWAAITLGPIFIVTAVALTSVGTAKEKSSAAASTNGVARTTNSTATNLSAVILSLTNNSTNFERAASTSLSTISAVSEAEQRLDEIVGSITNRAGTNVLAGAGRAEKKGLLQRANDFFRGRILAPLLAFVVLTAFLTVFYRLMPATKVKWSAALVGGAVGGGLLQLNNLLNIFYLSKVVTYSKIYGSLGAVPIFLLGLYFSWIIILLGAQVAYAFQNRQAYVQERQAESINQRGREFVALRLMTYTAQTFFLSQKPPTRIQMSNALGVPSQLTCQVLNSLVANKLLVEVIGDETAYAPGRPIEKISVEDILAALRVGQGSEHATCADPSRAVLREQFDRIVLAEMHAAGSVTLQNLVMRLASLPPSLESEDRKQPIAVG